MFRTIAKTLYNPDPQYNSRGFWSHIFLPNLNVGLKEIFYHYLLGLYNLFLGAKWKQTYHQTAQIYRYLEEKRCTRFKNTSFFKNNKTDLEFQKNLQMHPGIEQFYGLV